MLAVKREFGLAGIGMYWVTVEAIAEHYGVNGTPSLSLDLASWRELTAISPQMMRKWAAFGDEMALFSASFSEKTLTISIPKIKDIKDNHTSNLQAACSQEEEGEKEEEKNKKSTLTGTCAQAAPEPSPSCPHQAVIDLFHTILPELPRVRSWNETNKSHLRARWKSVGLDGLRMDSLDAWERLFRYIRTCPFLMGATQPGPGRKQFVSKLRWIVNQQNFQKIIEGDYEA